MNPSDGFLLALTLVASISPLLTITSLWQVKEWRVDRLVEHLKREHIGRQLFGILRPSIVILSTLLFLTPLKAPWIILSALTLLACLSIVQWVSKTQKRPRFTPKALLLIVITILITFLTITVFDITTSPLLITIPILQPFFVAGAWALLLPIDYTLKKIIIHRATTLRATYRNLTVIGITGSVGKTTTKELITHLLEETTILSTPAYVNSDMGIAYWLLRELPAHQTDAPLTLIVEMGAYRTGEIQTICEMVKPTIGIITFIGTQHIALFGSQEKLLHAKGELIRSLPEDGMAFINADSPFADTLSQWAPCPCTTIGTGHADLTATEIREEHDHLSFRAGDTDYVCPLQGTHNITNILLAIAVCRDTIDKNTIANRLRTFHPPSSTFSVRQERGVLLLDDTHNASPESFRAAIAWAKEKPMDYKVLITPGLIELGPSSTRIHRELGIVAQGVFDRIIFTNKHGIPAFCEGLQKPVELFSYPATCVPAGSLVVCVGRTPRSVIASLLPGNA